MDPNRLTQKSQEALTTAQAEARRRGHAETDSEHVLLALLEDPQALAPRLLTRMGTDTVALREALERHLAGRPTPPARRARRRGSWWCRAASSGCSTAPPTRPAA